jgi:hypothetical protein
VFKKSAKIKKNKRKPQINKRRVSEKYGSSKLYIFVRLRSEFLLQV